MPEAQKERKYEIHIPGQAKGTVVGDYATVTNIFEMTHPPAGIPFQAPPLPAHFVPRPEVSDTLKTRLLADEPTDPGVLVISAIHGLGGIGKSTIAAALAYDRDVQERFADGVLWVTLGQQPDLLSLLRGWIQALGGNHFRLTTVEMTTSYLRTLLQGKRSLLVVDDAWQIDHVTPFLAGGSSCHSLITTRERLVVKGVGAAAYAMDTMTSEQAVTLLGARLRRALLEDERVAASELARVVGHHPLALELAAMQLGDDISWNELLADLDREIARLESLESPGTDELVDEKITKRLSLRASFNLSLQRLKPELHHAFAWLGVLREDALITQAMATTLWGLEDERTAREWLRVLYDKALILSATPIRVSGRELSAYRLHDLMHDAARDVLTRSKPNGLEVALAQAHSKLLEHYRFKARDGLWHTLTEDGYIHGHLTWHMEKAGKEDEIHALLREETKEGKNGWYETRRRLGQLVGYLEDVERAWLASKLSGIAEIDVQLLYALVCSSVVARAENIEPPLMRSLSKQILSANQALSYARSMSDPARRFDALLAIVPSLDEELQQKVLLEALLEVERVKEAPCYSQRLKRYLLCTKYPAIRDRALDLALSELQAAPNEHQRSKALAKVLRQMPNIADPSAVIEGFSSSLSRTRVLCAIADSIEPRELKQLIVGILNRLDLDDDYAHASSLVQLGKHIPMDLIDELVQACLSVRRHDARAQACIGLAEWLDGNVRDMLLAEGRACADRIVHLDRRVTTLVSLAKTIAEDPETRDLFSKATDVAIHIEQVDLRAQALYQIAKYSSGEIRDYAFEQISGLVDRIGNSRIKGLMCAVLARHDTVKHLAQFLTDLAEGKIQAGEVALIAPGLADAELSSVLDQLSKIANDDARAKAIRSVIPHLPESLLNDAYLMASSIKRRSERARALTELARLFADTEREVILQEALEYTEIIKNDKARFEAISAFCRDLEARF